MNYVAAALTFIAGMAWNDAIKTTIDTYVKTGSDTIKSKYIYAIMITILTALLVYLITRLSKQLEDVIPDSIKLKDPKQ